MANKPNNKVKEIVEGVIKEVYASANIAYADGASLLNESGISQTIEDELLKALTSSYEQGYKDALRID